MSPANARQGDVLEVMQWSHEHGPILYVYCGYGKCTHERRADALRFALRCLHNAFSGPEQVVRSFYTLTRKGWEPV